MDDDDLFEDEEEEASGTPAWLRFLWVWIVPVVGAFVVFFGLGALRAPSLPERAPDFALKTVEGEAITLEQFRGQTVVLNFWATWCGPCMLEAPSFATYAQNNPDIVVLGMSADRQRGKVLKAKRDLGLGYPLVMTDEQTLAAYQVSIYPTTVVVNPDGSVHRAHGGMLFRPMLWALVNF